MRKADNYHPVIVLGATFAGIGTAYADRENTLIIERSALVGYEFINCFRTGTGWLDCKVSSEGERLRNELFEKNILKKDGKICISETAPVLYNRLVADNLNFLFMTDVVSIDSTSSAFEVEVYNASGFSRFIADKIIDTRPENIPPDQIQRKSINAILYSSGSTMFPDIHRPEAEFELTEQGVIIRFYVDATDDWFNARQKLHEFWLNRPAELQPWQILSVAQVFDIRPATGSYTKQENYIYINSPFYENPIIAFDNGYAVNLNNK